MKEVVQKEQANARVHCALKIHHEEQEVQQQQQRLLPVLLMLLVKERN